MGCWNFWNFGMVMLGLHILNSCIGMNIMAPSCHVLILTIQHFAETPRPKLRCRMAIQNWNAPCTEDTSSQRISATQHTKIAADNFYAKLRHWALWLVKLHAFDVCAGVPWLSLLSFDFTAAWSGGRRQSADLLACPLGFVDRTW